MDRAKFYEALRRRDSGVFGTSLTQKQVDRIEPVLDGLQSRGVPLRQSAYILATAYHESDAFKAMEEYASGAAYEGRKDLGNTVAGDGRKFKGRGYVQITGRRNYTDWGKRLGVDLLKEPQLAATPAMAVRILIDGMLLGTFTGKKLPDYVDGDKVDYYNARRVVNGTDKAARISIYAKAFEKALWGAGYIGRAPQKLNIPSEKPAKPVSTPEPQVKPSLLNRLLAALWTAVFSRFIGK